MVDAVQEHTNSDNNRFTDNNQANEGTNYKLERFGKF